MLNQKIREANAIAKQNKSLEEGEIPPWKRYSLSIAEAARYYGIGEKRLRQIAYENEGADFLLEVGSHVRIKRVLFEKYLDLATVV